MKRALAGLLAIIVAAFAAVYAFQIWHEPGSDIKSRSTAGVAEQVVRGAYLARAGNCMACHTARGGPVNAGGLALTTPFGEIYVPNITPDVSTGIGNWTADDFWRAMHNGKSKDGRLLYPAFPYPSYTHVTREDSDAIFAFLRTIPPANHPNREHALRFPVDQPLLLAAWRMLYLRPGVYRQDPAKSAEWNRGAYLVQGLGHCSACHAARNRFGATIDAQALDGGMMPGEAWYAPSLRPTPGRQDPGAATALQSLLRTGVSEHGAVFGPMAEVVGQSLQYLTPRDIEAMSAYLLSLPASEAMPSASPRADRSESDRSILAAGGALYEKHCAQCHGDNGEGVPHVYPALAGNHAMLEGASVNAIRMVINGGYPPSTAGNPRPFGMPPYGPFLSDSELASVVSFINTAWGNRGDIVSPLTVGKYRGVPVE